MLDNHKNAKKGERNEKEDFICSDLYVCGIVTIPRGSPILTTKPSGYNTAVTSINNVLGTWVGLFNDYLASLLK